MLKPKMAQKPKAFLFFEENFFVEEKIFPQEYGDYILYVLFS